MEVLPNTLQSTSQSTRASQNAWADAGANAAQEITFFEEGEPMIDGEAGDLKVGQTVFQPL